MIELPIGKALIAVKMKDLSCADCYFYIGCTKGEKKMCRKHERKDGKDVIYKLVKYKN